MAVLGADCAEAMAANKGMHASPIAVANKRSSNGELKEVPKAEERAFQRECVEVMDIGSIPFEVAIFKTVIWPKLKQTTCQMAQTNCPFALICAAERRALGLLLGAHSGPD